MIINQLIHKYLQIEVSGCYFRMEHTLVEAFRIFLAAMEEQILVLLILRH